jgi:hypothetical protein
MELTIYKRILVAFSLSSGERSGSDEKGAMTISVPILHMLGIQLELISSEKRA